MTSRYLHGLSGLLLIALATATSAEPVIIEFTERGAVSRRETLAQFRRDVRAPRVQTLAAASGQAGPSIRREYQTVFFGAAVDAAPGAVDELRRLPYVRAIHPDLPVEAYWTGKVADARERVNAGDLPVRGDGMVVAVIDSGIDYTHPALGGGFGNAFKVIGGWDFVNDDGDPMDDNGHGTHVAGTIAASSSDILGVAPAARLVAYKVLNAHGSGHASDIIAAMERAVDPNGDGDPADRVHVINLSLGGPGTADDPTSRAVTKAVEAGVVVVVAAGNAGGIGTIGSPGTAPAAITVGAIDESGAIASFSSRGPSPKLMDFKPEIVAPGVEIVSTALGHRFIAANGTSMAAPHVAGVCALLLEMNRDWTPARVKSALLTTTTAMQANPFARGAGRIDALAASEARWLVNESGLSLGLMSGMAGGSHIERKIVITNTAESAGHLTITTPSLPPGVTISVQPSKLDLESGASQEVTLKFVANFERLPNPEDYFIGGDVVFSGSRDFVVPWSFLRAARATVTYDAPMYEVLARSASGQVRYLSRYGASEAEMFVAAGEKWDFIVTSFDSPATMRILVNEEKTIAGDDAITLSRGQASFRIGFNGSDEHGIPLRDLPTGQHQQRTVTLRMVSDLKASHHYKGVNEIYFSRVSPRFTFVLAESYIDLIGMRGVVAQYPALQGVSQSVDLSAGPQVRARVIWNGAASEQFWACTAGALMRDAFFYSSGDCVTRTVAKDVTFDLVLTPETTPDAFSGLALQRGNTQTPAFRAWDGGIVASAEAVPSVVAHRIRNGAEVEIGSGPVHPFAYHGTTGSVYPGHPGPLLAGPFGEYAPETQGKTRWSTQDASGNELAWGDVVASSPPAPRPGGQLMIVRDGLRAAGAPSQGTLAIQFSQNALDLMAPTLTSLRVVSATGRVADTLAFGEAAAMHFSVADFDYTKHYTTNISRPERTRAWYRAHGTAVWQPLSVMIAGSEDGSRTSLRHIPAGDIYRVDLAPLTATAGAVDLRIAFEDAAGNAVQWTQEPALMVGQAPPTPRRRAARP